MRASLLLISLFFCAAHADDSCKVVQSKVVSRMPPMNTQGAVGFCYAFAATALIEQHYCTHKKGGCWYGSFSSEPGFKFPKIVQKKKAYAEIVTSDNYSRLFKNYRSDSLSVLDAIAMTKKGILEEGGWTKLVLDTVNKEGRIAKDECAPYLRLMSSDSKLFMIGVSGSSWWARLRQLYDVYKMSQKMVSEAGPIYDPSFCNQCLTADSMKASANLATSKEEIMKALQNSEFEEFVKQAVMPKKCEKSKVILPKMAISSLKTPGEQEIKDKLSQLLEVDTPVGISLCTGDDRCALHASVVSGVLRECCGDVCHTQYRLHDSDPMWLYQDQTKMKLRSAKDLLGYWIDEDYLVKKIMKAEEKTGKNQEARALVWIEK